MTDHETGQMDMPISCSSCSKAIELNDANFFVSSFCGCVNGSCTHGLCDACAEIENGDDDE